MCGFAIYISTTSSDYYLAKALSASLKYYSPDIPIYMLPDDSYAKPTLFGCPVWRPTDLSVLELNGYYKKLRIFWGPAERFLYLDADMLALTDPTDLINFVTRKETPFFMVCSESKVKRAWLAESEERRKKIFEEMVGNLSLISLFDRSYDWQAQMPFNSGLIAASRDVIDQKSFLKDFQRARLVHENAPHERRFTVSRKGIFMTDQGFLNYYVTKSALGTEYLDDVSVWGGNKKVWQNRHQMTGRFSGLFIHWAGCPRPSCLRLGIPAGMEWRKHYLRFSLRHGDFRGIVLDAFNDVRRLAKEQALSLKKRVLARLR